ncbi:hypothetical protein CS557_12655 [Acinetobacter junii]|nr:hypothetical protein CS557_12655 [Acinetobacter junii]
MTCLPQKANNLHTRINPIIVNEVLQTIAIFQIIAIQVVIVLVQAIMDLTQDRTTVVRLVLALIIKIKKSTVFGTVD